MLAMVRLMSRPIQTTQAANEAATIPLGITASAATQNKINSGQRKKAFLKRAGTDITPGE